MTRRLREKAASFLLDPPVYLGAMLLIALLAGLHQFLYVPRPDGYTRYNNYVIFKQSFVHLFQNQDLYALYPAEHFDNFLYGPTFAAFMAPFAQLPDGVGLLVWDLLNVAVLLLAVWKLPGLDTRAKGLALWFVAPELLGSIQSSQSNALVAGLVILAFVFCEREKAAAASLALALACHVKIFPAVGGLLFLLYRQRWRLVAFAAGWTFLLALVPLLFVSFQQLELLYGSWFRLHATSVHAACYGLSVQGWLHAWFGLDPPRPAILAAGGALALVPLANFRAYAQPGFRLAFLSSILVWMVIFNHLAESPTFVIAMCGVALWYFSQPRTRLRSVLAAAAFFFVSFAYSDLFPRQLRAELVKPYVLKAVPVIAVWLVLVLELTRWPGATDGAPATAPGPAAQP